MKRIYLNDLQQFVFKLWGGGGGGDVVLKKTRLMLCRSLSPSLSISVRGQTLDVKI